MHLRPLQRATALALTGLLVFAGAASADTVRSDGDVLTPGAQTIVDLGVVAPSALIEVEVAFELVCSNVRHVDPGQSITLTRSGQSAPTGGSVVSATPAVIGPVPGDWPAEGQDCPDPLPTLGSTTTSLVTLQAPAVENVGYMYTVLYSRSISPAGVDDAGALSGTATGINFRLAVAANTPPSVSVPGDVTVEGDTSGGWTATYDVSASDAEDDPDPEPVCLPAPGVVLPLGTTTVSCSATDLGGLADTADFDVTVVDTTAPSLAGVPASLALATGAPTGAAATWSAPTATDIVDPAPVVDCLPASGATFPVGTTTVTCSAQDASGNSATATFDVHVTYLPTSSAEATWGEPVGQDGAPFAANRGRTLPVKVTLRVDGAVQTEGDVSLRLDPCGGGPSTTVPMSYGGGRWNASLGTSTLHGSCYQVTAAIDGLDAGSFQLELRGAEAVRAKAAALPR